MWSILNNLNSSPVGNPKPGLKHDFHTAAIYLPNVGIQLQGTLTNKKFTNPNYINHSWSNKLDVSPSTKTNQIDVSYCQNSGPTANEPERNSSTVDTESKSAKVMCNNRKRGRKSRKGRRKKRTKTPEKHNLNRQTINELMDIENVEMDMSNCSDISDQIQPIKLGDLILNSSPVDVPMIDICIENTNFGSPVSISVTPPSRCSRLSTSESEDSFIVFGSETDEECNYSISSCDSDSESESDRTDDESDLDSSSSVIPNKKVRFANDKELCEVHPMVQWSYAYQAARKGPWEEYARDRVRFKKKIGDIGAKIGGVFDPEHREKVYKERFAAA